MQSEPAPLWLRKAGMALLVIWAVIFFLGAIGELFGNSFLREITDFKRIFLH
ncbi:MAG: hypothetical protein ACHQ1G_13735 [Planctomycetota bacterium]